MATQVASDCTNFRPAFRGNEDKPAAREGRALERRARSAAGGQILRSRPAGYPVLNWTGLL